MFRRRKRGEKIRRDPMTADRISRSPVFHEVRSETLAYRNGQRVTTAAHEAAKSLQGWYPCVEHDAIVACRTQVEGSDERHCAWGIEFAYGDDGDMIGWPVTRVGLAEAVAWCDKKNGGGV